MMQIYESLKAWLFKKKDEKAIKEELVESLKVLEGELGDGPYFGGRESIGFLDLVLVSYYTWLLAFEKDLKLNMESQCPKMLEWGKRCLQNKVISNNLADPLEIYEFVLKMRNMSSLA
ncbi:unnamed protein product [Cuscuta europaea]|uniref:GST C-terminal domain-containing protein n=2 Tax=Cuscuta europaea TaxID=41803 RepID=A0A9P1EES0_CUSEU|nr:unnamed protein product [Cuscuta europaea]